jgi:hypothetical protein
MRKAPVDVVGALANHVIEHGAELVEFADLDAKVIGDVVAHNLLLLPAGPAPMHGRHVEVGRLIVKQPRGVPASGFAHMPTCLAVAEQ